MPCLAWPYFINGWDWKFPGGVKYITMYLNLYIVGQIIKTVMKIEGEDQNANGLLAVMNCDSHKYQGL